MICTKEWPLNVFDSLTLSSRHQTINCSNDDSSTPTSNNRFLLLNQNHGLCLFDKECTMMEQCLWKYDRICDMCKPSMLNYQVDAKVSATF